MPSSPGREEDKGIGFPEEAADDDDDDDNDDKSSSLSSKDLETSNEARVAAKPRSNVGGGKEVGVVATKSDSMPLTISFQDMLEAVVWARGDGGGGGREGVTEEGAEEEGEEAVEEAVERRGPVVGTTGTDGSRIPPEDSVKAAKRLETMIGNGLG